MNMSTYFTSLDNDRGPISSAFFERDSMNENELSISLLKKDYSEKKTRLECYMGYCLGDGARQGAMCDVL